MLNLPKNNVIARYNIPTTVRWCKTCTISNQRPRIVFSEDGICNACQWKKVQNNIVNWAQREKELAALCDRHRKGNGEFDVIVPCSGGKDSGFAAHVLKTKYGMTPLTVTWSPHAYTDIGRKNLEALINSGFHNILGTPDGLIHRKLSRVAFIYGGHPFLPFIYGQINFPLQQAVRHNVPLIVYGENGEAEYGGDMKNADRATREISDHDRHYFGGFPLSFWNDHGITEKEIRSYHPPEIEKVRQVGCEIHFLGYYVNWDPQENYYYAVENTGFTANPDRTEGTYSKYASLDDKLDGFHYYMKFIKFGLGRAVADAAHEVRVGKITRDEGIALIRKFDGEFPSKHFEYFLKYVDLTESEFHEVIDSWRSDHLWKRENGKWALRFPIWECNEVGPSDPLAAARPL